MNENKYSWNLDDIVSLESYQDLFDKTRNNNKPVNFILLISSFVLLIMTLYFG